MFHILLLKNVIFHILLVKHVKKLVFFNISRWKLPRRPSFGSASDHPGHAQDTAKDRLLQHRRHAWHPKKCHGGPNFGWCFLVENPTKMDDLGVPPFQETTILKEDIWWKKKSASWENVLGIWLEGEFFLGPIRILRVYGRKKSRKYGASLGEASRTKNGFPTTQILLGIGTKYAGTKNMYWFQGLRI